MSGLVTALLAGCTATVDGGLAVEDEHGETRDPSPDPQGDGDDDPAAPEEPAPEEPLPPTPDGPVGDCWGAEHFDDGCSLERAGARYETALFPGETMAVLVSTSAVDDAVVVIWAPAADTAAGLSETVIFDQPGSTGHGQYGAVSLALPSAVDPARGMELVHATHGSTAGTWREAWQDEPTGIIAAFAAAVHDTGDAQLEWRASTRDDGIEASLSVSDGGDEDLRRVIVDSAGRVSYRYERIEADRVVETWTSADGRSWLPDGGDRVDQDFTSDLVRWSFAMPPAFGEGASLIGHHAEWGPEMGWLEGKLSGLTASFADGTVILSDLWVDVDAASIAALSIVAWDGERLDEWTTLEGSVTDGVEFPVSYQGAGRGRVEVVVDGRELIGVEATGEDGQVRLVAEDLLSVGESLGTAWRWEIVFDSAFGLATGEAAGQQATSEGCTRRVTFDFGTTWEAATCL